MTVPDVSQVVYRFRFVHSVQTSPKFYINRSSGLYIQRITLQSTVHFVHSATNGTGNDCSRRIPRFIHISFCPQCTDVSHVLYTFHFVHSVQTSPKFYINRSSGLYIQRITLQSTLFILSTVYRHLPSFIHISFCPQCTDISQVLYIFHFVHSVQTSPTCYTHFILSTVLPTELEMTVPDVSQVVYRFRFVHSVQTSPKFYINRSSGLYIQRITLQSTVHFVHSATNGTGNDCSRRIPRFIHISFCPQCTDVSHVLYTFHFVHSVQTSPKFYINRSSGLYIQRITLQSTLFILSTVYRHLPSFIHISFCPQCTDISQVLYIFHFVHSVQTSPTCYTHFILSTVLPTELEMTVPDVSQVVYRFRFVHSVQTSPKFYINRSSGLYIQRITLQSTVHFVHSATNGTGNDCSRRIPRFIHISFCPQCTDVSHVLYTFHFVHSVQTSPKFYINRSSGLYIQ